ncbi:acylphosphatase [Methylococcaceae bacterium WWC4]|nr:acylphosphatase [Methylococcaceae bacterium WWC4]
MKDCLHIIVKGRVQGVYFRAYTQKQAVKLNLSGFVRNLSDGSVEIVASGHPDDLQKLVAWCHKGPLLAKVAELVVNAHQPDEHWQAFEIR